MALPVAGLTSSAVSMCNGKCVVTAWNSADTKLYYFYANTPASAWTSVQFGLAANISTLPHLEYKNGAYIVLVSTSTAVTWYYTTDITVGLTAKTFESGYSYTLGGDYTFDTASTSTYITLYYLAVIGTNYVIRCYYSMVGGGDTKTLPNVVLNYTTTFIKTKA